MDGDDERKYKFEIGKNRWKFYGCTYQVEKVVKHNR